MCNPDLNPMLSHVQPAQDVEGQDCLHTACHLVQAGVCTASIKRRVKGCFCLGIVLMGHTHLAPMLEHVIIVLMGPARCQSAIAHASPEMWAVMR